MDFRLPVNDKGGGSDKRRGGIKDASITTRYVNDKKIGDL